MHIYNYIFNYDDAIFTNIIYLLLFISSFFIFLKKKKNAIFNEQLFNYVLKIKWILLKYKTYRYECL